MIPQQTFCLEEITGKQILCLFRIYRINKHAESQSDPRHYLTDSPAQRTGAKRLLINRKQVYVKIHNRSLGKKQTQKIQHKKGQRKNPSMSVQSQVSHFASQRSFRHTAIWAELTLATMHLQTLFERRQQSHNNFN